MKTYFPVQSTALAPFSDSSLSQSRSRAAEFDHSGLDALGAANVRHVRTYTHTHTHTHTHGARTHARVHTRVHTTDTPPRTHTHIHTQWHTHTHTHTHTLPPPPPQHTHTHTHTHTHKLTVLSPEQTESLANSWKAGLSRWTENSPYSFSLFTYITRYSDSLYLYGPLPLTGRRAIAGQPLRTVCDTIRWQIAGPRAHGTDVHTRAPRTHTHWHTHTHTHTHTPAKLPPLEKTTATAEQHQQLNKQKHHPVNKPQTNKTKTTTKYIPPKQQQQHKNLLTFFLECMGGWQAASGNKLIPPPPKFRTVCTRIFIGLYQPACGTLALGVCLIKSNQILKSILFINPCNDTVISRRLSQEATFIKLLYKESK